MIPAWKGSPGSGSQILLAQMATATDIKALLLRCLKKQGRDASSFHICSSCVIQGVFDGWYLLRTVPRAKSPRVCAQKGRPQAKGPLPPAGLKQVRASLPLPIGPSLSP